MSKQTEWTCKNCDADNAVCDCKQEPVAWRIDDIIENLCNHYGMDEWSVDIVNLKSLKALYTHPSSMRRLTAKEERALINPIMYEYGITATPFLELIDKVQDVMLKSKGCKNE